MGHSHGRADGPERSTSGAADRNCEGSAAAVDGSERTLRSEARTVVRALQGGLFATVVMTAFRLPLTRSLPPTANFWAKYVGGGDPEEYRAIGLLLHLLYGAVGGAAFGVAYDRLGAFPGVTTETRGVVWGGLYGLALSAFGEHVMLRRLLGMPVEPDTETVFHTSHLIYGVALGGWVGSRRDGPSDYEEYEETQ